MERKTLLAVVLSTLFLIFWWTFFQPKPAPVVPPAPVAEAPAPAPETGEVRQPTALMPQKTVSEKEITVDGANYRAVFTTRGAAIKHWFIKEKTGTVVDLVTEPDNNELATFPAMNFTVLHFQRHSGISTTDTYPSIKDYGHQLTFSAKTSEGITITKTYTLYDNYLHRVSVRVSRANSKVALPELQMAWSGGLGTDIKEQKENLGLTRVLAYPLNAPHKVEKLKPGERATGDMQWLAVDNRYFLCSFIFAAQRPFDNVIVAKPSKREPPVVTLFANAPAGASSYTRDFQLYLGPKGYTHLKMLNLNLEQAVDFGWFGFLGKIVLQTLQFMYKLTGNYGWAIILLTIVLQILVFPLSLKSFKASIAMKKLQPHIKALQEKYKGDPQRLNVEMMNLYKTQKVNPLGGCLPMILQLPIFWALFTTLRNAYELRGAPWMLWVTDLSGPDALFHVGSIAFNVLPLVMGIGMFVQQKLMSVTTDPSQSMMMYMMPVIFIFIFWNFPSGLVLYWLVNSMMTLAEQYIIMKRQETGGAVAVRRSNG